MLQPIFVEVMPGFDSIRQGELWISHKHRTINLRCPCGCGDLTVLSIHPSRWHVCFDGKAVTLDGPTGGSIWAESGCGSHYAIRDSMVVLLEDIDSRLGPSYAEAELDRLLGSTSPEWPLSSRIRRIWGNLRFRLWQK